MSPSDITTSLSAFAKTSNVRVLFAIESGSRAWGFASPDSDYDVRAVFVRPTEDYLAVSQPSEDLSAIDGDFDLGAWDLRKFLRLLRKSNATPMEWLQSPIRYVGDEETFATLLAFAKTHFAPRATVNHYRGLATKSWASFDGEGVGKLKKLFYVLRPLLAGRWIVERGGVAPMAFPPLLELLSAGELRQAIDEAVERKKAVGEGHVERVPTIIRDFIGDSFRLLEEADLPRTSPVDASALDDYFRDAVTRSTT